MQPIVLNLKSSENFQPNYILKGARAEYHWPKQQGYKLGSAGMWNFLWRLGFHPIRLSSNQLSQVQSYPLLFMDQLSEMDTAMMTCVQHWLLKGGRIIATGSLDAWSSFLPKNASWQKKIFNNPYAGLAYLMHSSAHLISPAGWEFIESKKAISQNVHYGEIAAISGERQTPERATITPYVNAPAIIQNGTFYYLNGQPFAAFQAWLQGQEDLSPWLNWRHRLFWLDEWVSDLFELLCEIGAMDVSSERSGIKNLKKTTVIIRHDLDYSRDLTFLKEENARKIAGTYAILQDRNTAFWKKILNKHHQHETAFHYTTAKRSWLALFHRYLTHKNRATFIPARHKIAGNGLLKQLHWATQKGIHIQTLHRHLSYILYPELIDALDTIFESTSEVLGSSSFFRGQILKWGSDRMDGVHGYQGDWPDAQFPLWYPFKLAHAGKQGKMLKGWEITSLMDVEPDMLNQLFNHRIKYINQTIFTLNYHPAHATSNSLYAGGSLEYFQCLLNLLQQQDIQVVTMRDVFHHANQSFLK